MWWVDPQHQWQLGLLCAGALLVLLRMVVPRLREGVGQRVILAVMLAVALGSTAAYTRFLDFHGPRRGMLHVYHDHDIYHYLIGARYYPQLGHQRLYECTWLGFAELRSSGVKTPKVPKLRSLRKPDYFFDPNTKRDKIQERCRAAFTDQEWRSFKQDLRAWLVVSWNDAQWRTALVDLGFNPPPTYNLFAHNLAGSQPLQNADLQLFPFIDMTLIIVGGGALAYWAFGPWGLFAYLCVFGTQWIASYRWTGGSYCRQLWFFWLVASLALLRKEKWLLAGAALATCVMMRVFPAVFVLGALAALAGASWREPERRRDLGLVVAGGLGATVLLGTLSIAQFGIGLWEEFFQKMGHHGTSWFMWHIGFKKLVVFDPTLAETGGVRVGKGFWWVAPALQDGAWAAARWYAEPIRIGASLLAVAIATRRKPAEAALIVGGTLLFFWSMPANYYYVYLAIAPAVFFDPEGDRWAVLRVALVFATMISLSCSAWVHPEPYVMNGWLNMTIFAFFTSLLASYVVELGLPWWRARQAAAGR